MQNAEHNTPSLVRAIFKDAALSFNLPKETTLAELAEELGDLGQRYGGMPIYVDVKLRS
jgi:hypothetical protein